MNDDSLKAQQIYRILFYDIGTRKYCDKELPVLLLYNLQFRTYCVT